MIRSKIILKGNSMNINNLLGIILMLFSLLNCQPQTKKGVHVAGELRKMMFDADISAQIDLKSLENNKYLYGLGALANLKGEILIFAGVPFITSVNNGMVKLDQSYIHKAALLVYTEQANWQQIDIPESVVSLKDLENYISKTSVKYSIPQDQPYPFLIRGKVKSAQWHVIDWPKGDTEHTHAKHKASGLHGTISDETVEILGFYSDRHQGVFTHHTTNMHLHVKNPTGNIAGHLDGLSLGKGMALSLPMN